MANRNIIWCQTSDASAFAKVQGKKYTHVIISALHMHCDSGNYVMYLNDTPVAQINPAFWKVVTTLRTARVTVTGLLAGAGNGTWDCIQKNPPKAMAALKVLTDAPYHLQGFDLDFETPPIYDPKLLASYTNLVAGIRPGLVITHAPIPSMLSAYDKSFWQSAGANLAWLNVQWYGESQLVQQYSDFVTGKTSGTAVDPAKVVAGATVVAQQGVGYTDLCQLMTMVNAIQKKPGIGQKFGGVAGWEFTQTIGSQNPKVANWDTCIAAALQGQTKCVACP
ncbi:MAG TPA: hypothetical protein VFQ41_12585 [Candidatus Angelobacter sp.]|nr:hypothetical protein [Candidatus Angelobacter sp.]